MWWPWRERHFGKAAMPATSASRPCRWPEKVEGQIGPAAERGTNDIRITPLGERIVEQARRVLAEAVKLEEIAEATGDPMTGQLRVGIIYTIAPYLLPQLIRPEPQAPMPLFLKEDFTGNLIPALGRRTGRHRHRAAVCEPGWWPSRSTTNLPRGRAGYPSVGRARWNGDELDGQNMLLLGQGNCFRDQVLNPACA